MSEASYRCCASGLPRTGRCCSSRSFRHASVSGSLTVVRRGVGAWRSLGRHGPTTSIDPQGRPRGPPHPNVGTRRRAAPGIFFRRSTWGVAQERPRAGTRVAQQLPSPEAVRQTQHRLPQEGRRRWHRMSSKPELGSWARPRFCPAPSHPLASSQPCCAALVARPSVVPARCCIPQPS